MSIESLFEGPVRDLTFKGAGVVDHPEGRVFFVDGVWPGDVGQFEILEMEKRYGKAKLVKLLSPSADRATVPCKFHGFAEGSCGGCPWMLAKYPAQLAAKTKILKNQLERAKVDLSFASIKPILPSVELGYRNRAQLKTDGRELGFVSRGTKTLAPINDCLAMETDMRETLGILRAMLPNPKWQPAGKHKWNFLEFEVGMAAKDVVPNKRIKFNQGNSLQNHAMIKWIAEKCSELSPISGCIELFAGSGNFTEALSRAEMQVVACELDEAAIETLRNRNLPNVKAVATNLYKPSSWNALKKEMRNPELLVLDPPREGFEGVDQFIREFPAMDRVLYVSCDLSSLLRDIRALARLGFVLKEIQPVDLFPQTPHLETLVLLTR